MTRTMRLLVALLLAVSAASAQKLNIRLVQGQGAINVIGDKTDRHFTVLVEERYGMPGKEIPVTFLAPATGASGTFKGDSRSITVETDEKGYAVARGFRPNKVPGKYNITVTAGTPDGAIQHTIAQTNALATEEEGKLLVPRKLFGKLRSTVTGLIPW